MARIAVIGAGAMGLAAAYHGAKAGHQVDVYEADDRPGGMAAHFDFDGLSIERYYHFICKSDQPTFDLMAELGIADRLKWRETSMGYFVDGKHYRWGDPLALLSFPRLDMVSKLRYGAQMFFSTKRRDAGDLENENVRDWVVRWAGQKSYDMLWRRLLELKFYEYADDISAAWIWTRIKRIGTSRKSMFQEVLGYIDGGSETLVDALVQRITALGGRIHLSTPVHEVVAEGGRVTGVRTPAGIVPHDAVICTVPTPLVPRLIPALPEDWKAKYAAIKNIGVACVILKLGRPVTEHFWLNVSDPGIPIPGVIQFSALRPTPEPILYVPYYMPVTNPKWDWPDADIVAEAVGCLARLCPGFGPSDVLASRVGRLKHAQPVCEPGFAAKIPPVQTPIAGLQVADTCFYYPEDRGIAESVRLGKAMAGAVR